MKLRSLIPNFNICLSVDDLFFPTISSRQTNRGNILIYHRYMNVEIGGQSNLIRFWK